MAKVSSVRAIERPRVEPLIPPDVELEAIRTVFAALKILNVDERMRVVAYVTARLSIPTKPLT